MTDDVERRGDTATATDVERLAIIDAVAAAITTKFGKHARETTKVLCWAIAPGRLEVALLKANCGTVVMPLDNEVDRCPYFGEAVPTQSSARGTPLKVGRSTNLANKAFPSLWWDRDLLYLRPLTKWELEETLRLIQEKLDGKPLENQPPPLDDISLVSLGFEGSHTFGSGLMSTVRAVYHRDGGRCQMCGSTHNLHVDHKIPRARGGGNEIENLWLLCNRCNLSKGDTI